MTTGARDWEQQQNSGETKTQENVKVTCIESDDKRTVRYCFALCFHTMFSLAYSCVSVSPLTLDPEPN